MSVIIKASAGSGKTFRLSNQYIAQFLNGTPVETILASTFTRKAAGEILTRILACLADAALDEGKRKELIDNLKKSKEEVNRVFNRDELTLKVAQLAKKLYQLRISTLDSFFNKIAAAFSWELKLPPGWTILDDAGFERAVIEAVGNVLADSERNDAKKLLYLLNQGESKTSITHELVQLAKDYLPLIRETKDHPDVWEHPQPFCEALQDDELQRQLNKLRNADIPLNKDKTPKKDFIRARDKLLPLIESGKWKEFIESTTLVESVIAGKKPMYQRTPIEGDWLESIQAFIEQAKSVLLNKLYGKTQATGKLLTLIAGQYDAVLERERGYRFEDVTFKLTSIDANMHTMSHRLDASTKHLLLDEFQDTSMPQWDIMKQFTRNADSVFVVGDVKQAIYGWRGGVAEIFDNVQEELSAGKNPVIEETIEKSYRSSPVIIETVNKIFGNIVNNEVLTEDIYQTAAKRWHQGFKLHETAKKYDGYVVLETVNADISGGDSDTPDDETPKTCDSFTEAVVQRIADLYHTHPAASIGVLVMRNDRIGGMIAGLKQLGIEASEEGGVPLTDSAAVQLVLSAMRLADHPGDSIARFHIVNSPLNSIEWQKMRLDLLRNGYGETISGLAKILAPDNDREFDRLSKLVELAYQFDAEAKGVRTRQFIKKVETTKVESPSDASIKVMTVHKSKGLEFDIVVLPDLDNPLVKKSPQIIVSRAEPSAPVDWVIRYADEKTVALLPNNYQEAFTKRKENEVVEALDVFYVAVTRAKRELVILVPEQSKKKKTYRNILLAALGQGYRAGKAEWKEESGIKTEYPARRNIPFRCTSRSLLRHLQRKSPSGQETVSTENTKLETGNAKQSRQRGTAIHACFEYVLKKHLWLDNYVPNKDELLKNVTDFKLKEVDWNEVADTFFAAIEKPNIRQTLSKSGIYAATEYSDVESERRLTVILDGVLWRGSVDRLIVHRSGGAMIHIEIIDYKSDQVERNDSYRPQMEAYRDMLTQAYKIDKSKISAKLLYTVLDKVVKIF